MVDRRACAAAHPAEPRALPGLPDALGSVGIIVAAVVIATTGSDRADTIAGMFITALIVPRAAMLLREALAVLMEFTPPGLGLRAVREHLSSPEHVRDVHDLHASTDATGLPTLTAHVVVDDECFTDGHAAAALERLRHCIAEHFEVAVRRGTFQLETECVSRHEPASLGHA